ncbi:hypothetical protein QTI51_09030 [Variovorax sp. J22G73]|jgi:hypothetical protein|uniref:hypothetical protein n=1 Tax=unclassified Variovorax TaxID=663243 RepID=UPI000D5E06E2|nr:MULTISPECIES: hypothetical protein [unclassified Variovorax]MDM0006558.1 hypothetical protein [Variovorax sp. J22R203]MDM0097418.1 hypothetical protein [Variovorax sp. J22G73]
MRGLGLIGLVLALLVVGLVAKKQMGSVAAPVLPAVTGVATGEAPSSNASNAHDQAQRVQKQVKDALDAAARTRQMPDDN